VLLCSGAQLLALGILAEYLWRALDAARNRPAFLIREVSELESVEASVAPGTPVIRATATGGRS